jgi:hypothetical protein
MSYIEHFKPLTKEDVETIRRQQGNTSIAVLLVNKPVLSEKIKEISCEVMIIPEPDEWVKNYYIMKNGIKKNGVEIKNNLPFIMSQEVYDIFAEEV